MNDLIQHIDKDLMVAAASEMKLRSEKIDDLRVDIYNPMTYESSLRGQGGASGDYPTTYTNGGSITVTTDYVFWETSETVLESESHTVGSDAPWAPEMYQKWDDEIHNRQAETWAVQQELAGLKRSIMQYLDDTGAVDIENSELVEDAGE